MASRAFPSASNSLPRVRCSEARSMSNSAAGAKGRELGSTFVVTEGTAFVAAGPAVGSANGFGADDLSHAMVRMVRQPAARSGLKLMFEPEHMRTAKVYAKDGEGKC